MISYVTPKAGRLLAGTASALCTVTPFHTEALTDK